MHSEYVHGSTVRNIEIEREERVYYRKAAVNRPKPKAVQWTPLYVIMLSAVAVLFCVVTLNNIKLNAEISGLREQKGTLTAQYENLVLSNDLYYDSITSQIAVEDIEYIAIAELGMVQSNEGTVMYYSGEMEDYVKQYANLPNQ